MALAKIKKGDTVVVLAGKDKGKSGEVTAVMPKDSKVVVAGVNIAVRHRNPKGSHDGITDKLINRTIICLDKFVNVF